MYKHCADEIVRRCVLNEEMESILRDCHSLKCGGHFDGKIKTTKVLQSRFYWPTLFRDGHSFVVACDCCQRFGNISRRNEMPLITIL